MRYLIKYTNMSESGIDRTVYGFLVMGFLMATLCLSRKCRFGGYAHP